ncbi:GntR family transcriptional regulator [Planosporangium sp. 12N6]|uniref:GntR family transcriptional regulator n=1 Tax=Planosporangium spinosum TaxID=3402278 RepID=UPI003CF8FDB0
MDDRTVGNRIAADLRRRIVTGALPPGAGLPSERELGEQYNASRGTIRRALGILVNEGLVTSRSGLGHFVRSGEQVRFPHSLAESRAGRQAATQDVWRSWVAGLGRKGDAILTVAIDVPPAHVAEAFGIPAGEKVVIRRRTRLVDGEPWMLSDAHFPLSIAGDTPLAQAGDLQPGPLVLLRELGHEPVRHADEIRGRMPTPEEAKALSLEAGVPIIEVTRVSCDKNGTTVRATVNVFPANRFIVVYDLDEDRA